MRQRRTKMAKPYEQLTWKPPERSEDLDAFVLASIEDDGAVVFVAGRNSGVGGQKVYEAIADDIIVALNCLRDRHGLDFLPFGPSRNELIKIIRGGERVVSTDAKGTLFEHRYAYVDLREHGLFIDMAAGSGRRMDEDHVQPYAEHLAEQIRRVRPVLVFAKRIDRLTRKMLPLAVPLMQMEACGALLGDSRRGFRVLDTMNTMYVFFDASDAEGEAAKTPSQSRNGMVQHTGERFEDGRV